MGKYLELSYSVEFTGHFSGDHQNNTTLLNYTLTAIKQAWRLWTWQTQGVFAKSQLTEITVQISACDWLYLHECSGSDYVYAYCAMNTTICFQQVKYNHPVHAKKSHERLKVYLQSFLTL